MGHAIQRFGFRIGRGWSILLLIAAAMIGATFWIGPLRPLPAELELLAIAGDTATHAVHVTGVRDDEGRVRFAVPLAMRNVGARAADPSRLSLSVPAQFRVSTRRGPLQGEVTAGVPLRRYLIALRGTPLQPGLATARVPGLDTLWLEPELPRYYCTTHGTRVPEFSPAPSYDPALLATVRIFYSFSTRATTDRNAGLLTVQVDSALLQSTPAPMPPAFRTEFREPEAPVPELSTLEKAGARTAFCGDPERALELFTTRWLTERGGSLYVIYVDGAPRKQLYDLNADDVIELETWDADGDGRFEARREARFTVPEFLMPRLRPDDLRLLPDTAPPDSTWLALFADTRAGPWRFSPRVRAAVAAAAADSAARDSARSALLARADSGDVTVADSGFVQLFNDTAAGPFRFTRPVAQPQITPVEPTDPVWLRLFHDTTAGPFRFTQPPPDTIAPDTVRPPPPAPRPRRRGPLGVPIPYSRPPGSGGE